MTIQTYPVTSIGASFLVVKPKPSQNLTTLAVDFIALLGKYQNTLVESGIVSVLIPFEAQYILVGHKVSFIFIRPHIVSRIFTGQPRRHRSRPSTHFSPNFSHCLPTTA